MQSTLGKLFQFCFEAPGTHLQLNGRKNFYDFIKDTILLLSIPGWISGVLLPLEAVICRDMTCLSYQVDSDRAQLKS